MKKLVKRRLNSWITSLPLRLPFFLFDDLDSILGPSHRGRRCQVSVKDKLKENLYQVSCPYIIPSVPVHCLPSRELHLLSPAESCSVFPEWPKRALGKHYAKLEPLKCFHRGVRWVGLSVRKVPKVLLREPWSWVETEREADKESVSERHGEVDGMLGVGDPRGCGTLLPALGRHVWIHIYFTNLMDKKWELGHFNLYFSDV